VQALKDGVVIETIETTETFAVLQTTQAEKLRIAQGAAAYGYGAVLEVLL